MTIQQLRSAHRAAAFQPFTIHMADGRTFPVPHPDFLSMSPSGRTVIIYQENEEFSIPRSVAHDGNRHKPKRRGTGLTVWPRGGHSSPRGAIVRMIPKELTRTREGEVLMRNYKVVLHRTDEGISVSVPGLPGCWSEGDTEEEALANIQDAIQEHLAALEEQLRDAEVREVEVTV